jgi:AcrR family transcriptional regulator
MDFTLREVARRIGVSHAAPYRHFADKGALVTELGAAAGVDLAARIEAALLSAGRDLRAQFLGAGLAYVRFALERPASFQAMMASDIDTSAPSLVEARSRSFGLLLRFIEDAQKAGVFPPGEPMELAIPIWAMHHGLAHLALSGAFEVQDPSVLRRVVDDAHARLLDGLWIAPTASASPRWPGSARPAPAPLPSAPPAPTTAPGGSPRRPRTSSRRRS